MGRNSSSSSSIVSNSTTTVVEWKLCWRSWSFDVESVARAIVTTQKKEISKFRWILSYWWKWWMAERYEIKKSSWKIIPHSLSLFQSNFHSHYESMLTEISYRHRHSREPAKRYAQKVRRQMPETFFPLCASNFCLPSFLCYFAFS